MMAHCIYADEVQDDKLLAMVHSASEASVNLILSAPLNTSDGRSEWVWLRLPNGDLILGIFPQGDTYLAVEDDAQYPK